MAAKKSAVTQATEKLRAEAQDLDDRRQTQIRNQVASINRLMAGGTYDTEMAKLHEELADTQVQLEGALLEIRRLKEEAGVAVPSDYDLGQNG